MRDRGDGEAALRPPQHTLATPGREVRRHSIEVRASVPLLLSRYYVVILVGQELRNPARLNAEGQTLWLRQLIVYGLLSALLMSAVVGAVVIVYLLKCALRINVLPGASPLHFIYELVFV